MSARDSGAGDSSGRDLDREWLRRLGDRVSTRQAVDVGGIDGTSVEALLEAGWPRVYVAADPVHARALATRFANDRRVQVLDVAPGDGGHGRTLGSLVEDGAIPAEIGLLTIGAHWSDLDGVERLAAEVVITPYRHTRTVADTPAGPLPELAERLAKRGYGHTLVATSREGFRALQLDVRASHPGEVGCALFVHDRAYPALAPFLHQEIAETQDRLLTAATTMRELAERRLETVRELGAELARARSPRRWGPRIGALQHHAPRPMEIPDRYRVVPTTASAPRISIVTATLNAGRFLERTLRSILDQRYSPLEYVVQDGGSTDDTVAILDRYRDRLTAYRSERDRGQADALNRGFARTSGEIMGYMNGDDLLLPGALGYVAEFFARRPDVDVVYGHRVLIDKNDAEIGRWVLPRHSRAILSWIDPVPQETLFWRRSIWERVGGRLDESFHFALDWELLLRFQASGATFVRLPRFIGAFRIHEDQKTLSRMADLGRTEMQRLREHEHGRRVGPAEIRRRIRGYLLRHIVHHKLYRLGVLSY